MDDNLIFNGEDSFWYSIKTYHAYSGSVKFKKGKIKVVIHNFHKGKLVKEMKFSSKVLDKMAEDQIKEYILDCLYIFDKRIDEYNQGNRELT